jgi:hypothetical protein
MKNVIVVALVVAFELCSGDFRAHVIQVQKDAVEGAKSCPAAAYCGVAHLIQSKLAVTIADPH